MICNRIQIRNFRNIETADVEFDEGVNILTGENAQGKTNLLEAIGYTAIGKSFRAVKDEEMIKFGEEYAEISLDFTDSQRRQNITVRMAPGKRKRIEQNKVKIAKVSEIVGQFRTVLFTPEHLAFIKDGPGERRNFLDIALSQLYPVYLASLQRYNHVLKQRNQLLRDAEEDRKNFDETVEFWSSQLAKEAATISQYRARYIEKLNPSVQNCFAQMTGGKEIPEVFYDGSAGMESYEDVKETERKYFELLMNKHDREIGAGSTLWGIHKDDVEIKLNGKSARLYASQGQQRSLALAMKLGEGEICRDVRGEIPVFLLDDVFSELDAGRRKYLADRMEGRQVIITSCEPNLIGGGKKIRVENGRYEDWENLK